MTPHSLLVLSAHLLFLLTAAVPIAAAGESESGATSLESRSPFRDCDHCPEMVGMTSSRYLMGALSDEADNALTSVPNGALSFAQHFLTFEKPAHWIDFHLSFALGKYLVTRSEYASFVRETGYKAPPGCVLYGQQYTTDASRSWRDPGFTQTDRDPVVCVSWEDAQAFVHWLNSKTTDRAGLRNGTYRLPSEAEWEFAARAGTRTQRWWGDAIGSNNANCDECGSVWDGRSTAPVGSFRPTPSGLFDILGNVWEWIDDCWNANYVGAPADGSSWHEVNCTSRVLRGGSWSSSPWLLASSRRTKENASARLNYVGFRVLKYP